MPLIQVRVSWIMAFWIISGRFKQLLFHPPHWGFSREKCGHFCPGSWTPPWYMLLKKEATRMMGGTGWLSLLTSWVLSVVRLFCSGSGADANPFRDFVHLIPPRGRAILAFSPSQVCQNFIYLVNFKTMPCVTKPWRYNLIKLLHFKTYSRNIKISLP